MTDKFKRITQSQLDLWLIDPVTKAYQICLSEMTRNAKDSLIDGSLVDSSNNDRSMNAIHSSMGMVTGYENARLFTDVFKLCAMVESASKEQAA